MRVTKPSGHDPDVQDDILVPARGNRTGEAAKLRKLVRVGQSVLFEGRTEYGGIYTSLKQVGLRGKCTVRLLPEGVRVWRVR